MSNRRITKKFHSRYLADFFVECSQDPEWEKKLRELKIEDKLNTVEDGFPADFAEIFPETQGLNLQYCIERITLADVPRAASCWWPTDENTQFYMAYPAEFPQSSIYMAIDFPDGHENCCG